MDLMIVCKVSLHETWGMLCPPITGCKQFMIYHLQRIIFEQIRKIYLPQKFISIIGSTMIQVESVGGGVL